MIFDQPHLYEIEDLIDFTKKHRRLYIYGCAEKQEYLLKFLDICGVAVAGYITTYSDARELEYRELPKYTLETVSLEGAGVIIGLSDRFYDGVIPALRERGFNDYFLMSEHTKRTIAHKLTPRPRERMLVEVNLADHCNLNCQMCDHFSQLVKQPVFLDKNAFERDMKRLAELSGAAIATIRLLGGEPLLNRDVNKYIEISRALFPESIIEFYTNGLLLLESEKYENGNFWGCCRDNKARILLTQYPINLDILPIEEKAKEYGVEMQIFGEVADRVRDKMKHSTKHPFNLAGDTPKRQFISCYHLNECVTLQNGRLYTCPTILFSHYFNETFAQNLTVREEDGVDIYKAKSYEELVEALARRVPFCGYCDIKNRRSYPWGLSKRTIDEYVDLD